MGPKARPVSVSSFPHPPLSPAPISTSHARTLPPLRKFQVGGTAAERRLLGRWGCERCQWTERMACPQEMGNGVPAWEPKPECTKGWHHRQAQGRPARKGFGPLLHGDSTPDLGHMAIGLTVVLALLRSTVGWGWGLGRVLREGWRRLAA